MAKALNYRKGDEVSILLVSRELPEGCIEKISMPDVFRGLKGVVVQVRPFDFPGFQSTIVLEITVAGAQEVIATEPQHIRLLKRGPKV